MEFSLLNAFLYAGLAMVAVAVMTVVYNLAKSSPTAPPARGSRGLQRARAMEAGDSFTTIEPLIRLVASWIAPIRAPELRRNIDRQLVLGGDWLGLTANEFLALSGLSGLFFLTLGLVGSNIIELSPIFGIFFGVFGGFLPHLRVSGEIGDRFKAINRGLPTAIDLASLCMGAGLDFPGALRQIADKAAAPDDPLTIEIQRILQELELGRTRRQALENFADRCPTDSVQDFVGAVVQAEEKGNPLAEVLRIQARMLRMKRSVMAEENAAKAALMLMGPLMLIFCSIILILMGPFVVNSMGSGM